jgi:serine/threonine-protein kinase
VSAKILSLRELFDAVVDLASDARAEFFAAHDVDPVDRVRLQVMLEARSAPGGAVPEVSAEELDRALGDEDLPGIGPGTLIGAFVLTDVLGEGGSSTVFRAERTVDGVRQIVALKVLRRGWHSPDAKRQFRRERRALAQLRHPNIAHLIEGGVTETGLAYIALEAVDGVPITDYVRAHRLDLRSRLMLFLRSCRAVEAAHRALIVHRDLKPTNVLVTTDGEVKLLDFGIAKLLDADDETQTRLPAFTPAYAAPEQRNGGLITTATDVYALGVLLGELVTGERVNDQSGRTPSSQIGAASEPGVLPATPNITRRQIRGDLDNIVLKAIDEDPARRYASAGALADDIERLLEGRPVAAHQPSGWYRAQKFVKRHKGGVAITIASLVAALITLGIVLWQARVARQEAERANLVRDFLVSVFTSAETSVPKDRRPSVDDIIKSATTLLRTRASLPDASRADLLLTLAKVAGSVGSFDLAINLLDERDSIVHPSLPPRDAEGWDAVLTRADIYLSSDRQNDAVRLLGPLRDGLLARHDETAINALMMLGEAIANPGNEEEGLALLRQTRILAESDPRISTGTLLAAEIREASNLIDTQRFEEGTARADAALALWHKLGDPALRDMIELYYNVALSAEARGDMARAESSYKQSIVLADRFFDRANLQTAWDLEGYGTFLIAQGRADEAEPYVTRSLEMHRAVLPEDDHRTLYAIAAMGKLRHAQGNDADAVTWFTQGIVTCRKASKNDQVCGRLLALRARAYAAEKRFADAERDIEEATKLQLAIGGEEATGYAYVLDARVAVETAEHRYEQAIATAERALSIYANTKAGLIQSQLGMRFWRAFGLFELHRDDEALREVLDIEPKYMALFPRGALGAAILALKARALDRAQRFEEAHNAAESALAAERTRPSLEPEVVDALKRIAREDVSDTHRNASSVK